MALPLSLELRSILASHWLTLLHRVESSIFVRFGRPKRLSSTSLDSNRVLYLAVGIGGKAKVSRMRGVNGIVKFSVVDSPLCSASDTSVSA